MFRRNNPHFEWPRSLMGANVFSYLLLALFSLLFSLSPDSKGVSLAYSLIVLIIAFPLLGFNLSQILERIIRKRLDFLERVTVSAVLALIFAPLFLTLESSLLGLLSPALPLVNTAFFFAVAFLYSPLPASPSPSPNDSFFTRDSLQKFAVSFLLGSLLYLALAFAITFAYYPLPDLDPYYWLGKYSADFQNHKIAEITGYRPLFSSLVYIYNQSAGVDLYGVFKYVISFLMFLVVLPAALVARKLSSWYEQFAILLLPLSSASFILYFHIPIPQALLNICLVYYIFFLIYSWITQKKFFYFIGGGIIFFTYFFHETAVLFFLPWLLGTFFVYRKQILAWCREESLAAILLFLLIVSYSSLFLSPMYGFVSGWMSNLGNTLIHLSPNYSYPASYVNIDGNAVGWGDWKGVVKYYLFYASPAIFTILLFLFIRIIRRNTESLRIFMKHKELFPIALAFALFMAIAEILPRFFNVSLLPERAWGFAGILLLSIVPIILHTEKKYKTILSLMLILAFLTNAGTALYINSLKKYLITPEQVSSAEWIKTNLPEERVIISLDSHNLLRVHAQSPVFAVKDPLLYSDKKVFDTYISAYLDNDDSLGQKYSAYIDALEGYQRNLDDKSIQGNAEEILLTLRELEQSSEELADHISAFSNAPKKTLQPTYIYYSDISPKHPYAHRPYFTNPTLTKTFVFDDYPEDFRRVYSLSGDEVVIWQYLP